VVANSNQDNANRQVDGQPSSLSATSTSGAEVRTQMVYLAFKDTIRLHGVPSAWIECKVRMLDGEALKGAVQVVMSMRHWSGHLLRYSMAFQHQMLLCLDRYEPAVDHSKYEWLWRYTQDCECPFPNMPPPQEWQQKLKAKAPPKAVDIFERRKTPRTSAATAKR